jgi:DNA-binding beta-propeller fold protein YncE
MKTITQKFNQYFLIVGVAAALSACASGGAPGGSTSYFLSVQDGRAGLDDGKSVVRSESDSLAVVSLSNGKLSLAQELVMPTSLVGPPSSVAIAPNKKLALISAATKRDPNDPKKVVDSDLVSVVVLDSSGNQPPKVHSSVVTGIGPSGISINATGTYALVANRAEGTVSLLSINGNEVKQVSKLTIGAKSGPASVVFLPDGKSALLSRDGDNRISLLKIADNAVTLDKKDLYAGLRPYGLDVAPDGSLAAVTNLGSGQGDLDTISLIDLKVNPPRVVDTVTVGQTPEGIFFSPDSKYVGVTVIDGSNKPKASPFNGVAKYRFFKVDDKRLTATSQIVGGQWLQGHAFTPDGVYVLVQDAANRKINLYQQTNGSLVDTGESLQMKAAPSTIKYWR